MRCQNLSQMSTIFRCFDPNQSGAMLHRIFRQPQQQWMWIDTQKLQSADTKCSVRRTSFLLFSLLSRLFWTIFHYLRVRKKLIWRLTLNFGCFLILRDFKIKFSFCSFVKTFLFSNFIIGDIKINMGDNLVGDIATGEILSVWNDSCGAKLRVVGQHNTGSRNWIFNFPYIYKRYQTHMHINEIWPRKYFIQGPSYCRRDF